MLVGKVVRMKLISSLRKNGVAQRYITSNSTSLGNNSSLVKKSSNQTVSKTKKQNSSVWDCMSANVNVNSHWIWFCIEKSSIIRLKQKSDLLFIEIRNVAMNCIQQSDWRTNLIWIIAFFFLLLEFSNQQWIIFCDRSSFFVFLRLFKFQNWNVIIYYCLKFK